MNVSLLHLSLVSSILIFASVKGFKFTVFVSVQPSQTQLFSERRQPRRMLKKRRNRGPRIDPTPDNNDIAWESAELRPLISSKAKEAGEDYWIDEKDLQASQARAQAIKNRKQLEGEIPKEKLWEETLAPYKQNWIGIVSVVILVLATMVTKFPELLETPSPGFPDL